MFVIGCVAQKGGGGKTTLATCLAVHAATRKSTVGLLDMDPQQSLADWYERRGQPKNPQLYAGVDTASEAIELLGAQGLDYLFIDTGPGLLHAIEPVIAVSDLILVPVKASAFDLMAIAPTLEVARECGKPYLVVLNENISSKMESTATELLGSDDHSVAKAIIKQRVAYRSAATTGHTGPERDDKCAEEITSLWNDVKAALKGRKSRG